MPVNLTFSVLFNGEKTPRLFHMTDEKWGELIEEKTNKVYLLFVPSGVGNAIISEGCVPRKREKIILVALENFKKNVMPTKISINETMSRQGPVTKTTFEIDINNIASVIFHGTVV